MKPQVETQTAEFTCSTCQKPISLKARTDVTRFLSFESRCVCQGDGQNNMLPQLVEVIEGNARTPIESVQETLGDGYEVLQLLRAGATGDVYKVRDRQLDKVFAIKVLHPELAADINTVKVFQQQARAAQDLTHANLAAVYNCQQAVNGIPFVVMDYLDGDTLSEELAKHGFIDVPRAIDMFIQIAEALGHAHLKGIPHQDLKPTNIILCHGAGGQDFVKLVDFGVAKTLVAPEPGTITPGRNTLNTSKQVSGSPRYMSPEQCLGRPLDARSDIYSLGCIMYEALTNVPVFVDKNPIRTMVNQVASRPRAFAQLKHEYAVPPHLEQIVFRCLEKNPSGRYQTADALIADLKNVRDGRELASSSGLAAPLPKKTNPLVRKLVAAMILISPVVFWIGSNAFFHHHIDSANAVPPSIEEVRRGEPSTRASEMETANTTLTGDPTNDVKAYKHWAQFYYEKREYQRAAALFEFAISVYNDGAATNATPQDNGTKLARLCERAAKCYVAIDQPERALPHLREAILLFQEAGDSASCGRTIDEYAGVLRKLKRPEVAERMLQEFMKDGNLQTIP